MRRLGSAATCTGGRRHMAQANNPAWHVMRFGQACPEVRWSGRLTLLAAEAEAEAGGFPCTAEHLRHLAGYVLDEAATKYDGGPPQGRDSGPRIPSYRGP